jgi:tetratricopeptide (TPR) repeat protein
VIATEPSSQVSEPESLDARRIAFEVSLGDPLGADAVISLNATGARADDVQIVVLNPDNEALPASEEVVERQRRRAVRFPTSAAARVGYAEALSAARRYSESVAELRVARQLSPDNATVSLRLGETLISAGMYEEAERLLTPLAIRRNIEATLSLARLHVQQHRLQDALQLWEAAVAIEPTQHQALFGLGLTHLALGRPDLAVHTLRDVVRSRPGSAAAHHALGIAYRASHLPRKAEVEFRVAVSLMPSLESAILGVASALVDQNRSDDAVRLLEPLDLRSSIAPGTHELVARVHLKRGHYRAAIRALELALDNLHKSHDTDPDQPARIRNNIGVCWLRLGSLRRAESAYREALSSGPSEPIPYHNIIRLLLNANRLEEARQYTDDARQQFPDDDLLRLLDIRVTERSGAAEEAIRALTTWTTEGNAPVYVWNALGSLLVEDPSHREEAIELLRIGIRLYPRNPILQNNLAYALLMNGLSEEASAILEIADPQFAQEPQERRIAEVLLTATTGLAHLRRGDIDDGVAGYLRAAELATEFGVPRLARRAKQKMHLEVARTLIALERYPEAGEHLRQGKRLNVDQQYSNDIDMLLDSLPIGI